MKEQEKRDRKKKGQRSTTKKEKIYTVVRFFTQIRPPVVVVVVVVVFRLFLLVFRDFANRDTSSTQRGCTIIGRRKLELVLTISAVSILLFPRIVRARSFSLKLACLLAQSSITIFGTSFFAEQNGKISEQRFFIFFSLSHFFFF